MTLVWLINVAVAIGLVLYAYAGYPLLLKGVAATRRAPGRRGSDSNRAWPLVSISIPAYNEEASIRATLDRILEADYPPDRRQVLVVSDASTDRTDQIVAEYADRGVELLRVPERGGKTAAENAARSRLRGEIIVNTDASVRIHRAALKPLIAEFDDPTVGVASGRDVSVASLDDAASVGESGYVGYEMWVRDLETQVSGIVGASGCFYAIRRELHMQPVPGELSRDFASALIAREHGFRAVSVNDAVCFVPRSVSLQREFRRKIRTISRGIETLWYKRHLLNPLRYGLFSWMLASHKVARWLVPVVGALAALGLGLLAVNEVWARWGFGLVVLGTVASLGVLRWPEDRTMPKFVSIPAFLVLGNVSVLVAWINALRGRHTPIWEPTRRPVAEEASQAQQASR